MALIRVDFDGSHKEGNNKHAQHVEAEKNCVQQIHLEEKISFSPDDSEIKLGYW